MIYYEFWPVWIVDFRWYHFFKIPFFIFTYGLQISFWPFYNMIKTLVIKCQYQTSTGMRKSTLHNHLHLSQSVNFIYMSTYQPKCKEDLGCLLFFISSVLHIMMSNQSNPNLITNRVPIMMLHPSETQFVSCPIWFWSFQWRSSLLWHIHIWFYS